MRRTGWLVLGACLVLLGCNPAAAAPSASAAFTPAPIDSPPPSASPEPSPSEFAAPSFAVPGDSVPIPADTYARVVTDDLRVRSKPGVSEDSKKLEPLLQEPMSLLVLDGPVQSSGYDWYLVQPIPSDMDAATYPFGWIAAAGKDGEPWIQADLMGCPPTPQTVDDLGSITQTAPKYYEITCFGGDEITFQARIRLVRSRLRSGGAVGR